jgi:hypothetical protein
MVEIVEMDKRITLDKQLEEDIGPVILINKFNLDPQDVDQFLKAWASDAEIMKKQPGFIQPNYIGALLKVVRSSIMLYGNPHHSSSKLLVILSSKLRFLSTLLVR